MGNQLRTPHNVFKKIKLPCLQVGYCYFKPVILKDCSDFQCPEYDDFEITNVHGVPIETCDAVYKDVIKSCTIDKRVASLTCNSERPEFEKSVYYNEDCPAATEYSCWTNLAVSQIPAPTFTCELEVVSGGTKANANFLLIVVVIVLLLLKS